MAIWIGTVRPSRQSVRSRSALLMVAGREPAEYELWDQFQHTLNGRDGIRQAGEMLHQWEMQHGSMKLLMNQAKLSSLMDGS